MLVWSRGRASLPLGVVPSWRASTDRASLRPDLMKLHVWCDTCRTMSAGPWLQGPSSRGSKGISTMAPSRSSHGAEQSCHPLIHGHDLEPDLGTRPPAPVSLFQLTPRLPTSAPNPLFLLLPIASPAPLSPSVPCSASLASSSPSPVCASFLLLSCTTPPPPLLHDQSHRCIIRSSLLSRRIAAVAYSSLLHGGVGGQCFCWPAQGGGGRWFGSSWGVTRHPRSAHVPSQFLGPQMPVSPSNITLHFPLSAFPLPPPLHCVPIVLSFTSFTLLSSSPSPSASLLVLFPSHPHFHRPTPSISPSSLASHTCILHSHLVGAPRDSCVRGGM